MKQSLSVVLAKKSGDSNLMDYLVMRLNDLFFELYLSEKDKVQNSRLAKLNKLSANIIKSFFNEHSREKNIQEVHKLKQIN